LLIIGKPSVLIVDDDIAILHVFSKIFQRKGYSVQVAEKSAEAIEKLKLAKYDVALIDFGLPDMNGLDLFPLINNESPKTLKIMLTGKTWLLGSIEGADAFLGKPVNPDRLLSIIETKLKNRDVET